MADRNAGLLSAEAARLGDAVHPIVADVSDPASVDAVGQAAADLFGGLNIAVNNAGIVNRGNTWELSVEEWRQVLDVNLWGVIHGIRTFVPLILATGQPGHVVNTASMSAVVAIPQLGPYAVAKHGVLGLSEVLRAELAAIGAPVGVSAVLPGLIKTGLVPMGIIPASTVAANIIDGIRLDRPYVFTDDHATEAVEARLEAIKAARREVVAG